MSESKSPADGPTTEQEFRDAITSLIRSTHANGVDVEGGWDARTQREDRPDWGVEIYRVAKREETAD